MLLDLEVKGCHNVLTANVGVGVDIGYREMSNDIPVCFVPVCREGQYNKSHGGF